MDVGYFGASFLSDELFISSEVDYSLIADGFVSTRAFWCMALGSSDRPTECSATPEALARMIELLNWRYLC